MKPLSYPFLRIAKAYGLPYEMVLRLADHLINNRSYPHHHPSEWDDHKEAFDLVVRHGRQFIQIRQGLIDWQTGERIAHNDAHQSQPA